MNVGGCQEVLAASDVGDFLKCIVHHDGEVVGGTDVFSGEHNVAECVRVYRDFSKVEIFKDKWSGDFGSALSVEPPGVGDVRSDFHFGFFRRQVAARCGID